MALFGPIFILKQQNQVALYFYQSNFNFIFQQSGNIVYRTAFPEHWKI